MLDPESNAAFYDIVQTLDIPAPGIDGFKDDLLSRLDQHLLAFGDININDEEVYDNACIRLSSLLEKDVASLEGLRLGDSVVYDGSVCMLMDTIESTSEIYALPQAIKIEGIVARIIVSSIPDCEPGKVVTDYDEDDNPIPIQRFGLLLILDQGRLVEKGGITEEVSAGQVLCIPLSHRPSAVRHTDTTE